MASLGPKDVTTVSDMEEQHQKQQEEDVEKTLQTVAESASVESKTTTAEERYTVEETTTVGEMPKATTVEEHNISEVFVSTSSISAVAIAEIAETIAANDSVKADMDYSVAATMGTSVDGESVRTEDFAEEEAFIEESSKEAEVDFADLAAADDNVEDKAELGTGVITDTTEEVERAPTCSTTTKMKEISAEMELEMDCSVAATLGSSVDVDSVLSLDDMRDSTTVDGSETTDALVEEETIKSTDVSSDSEENSASIEVVAAESDVDTVFSVPVVEETSIVMTPETKSTSTPKVKPVIEEVPQDVMITETEADAVTAVAFDTASNNSEVKTFEEILTEVSSEPSDGFHALTDSSTIPDTATEKPEHEAEVSETTQPKSFSVMITPFAEKPDSKTGPHRTDSAAKLELSLPSHVENIVHSLEVHETVSPQTHRTPSAAKLDLSGSSPVKNVVHRLETHQEEDNALESLKIRTKRDFFSEKRRSISVSHEKEKYNSQMAQRAQKEAEAKEQLKSPAKKHSPVFRKSSAMSSVRNMASRFEKKVDQSLDDLSFRTVRSFFPNEKSIHVGAEKQKYEALEKEKQSAKEVDEKFAKRMSQEQRTSSDMATISTETKERATEEPLAEDSVVQETPSLNGISTPTKHNETATFKTNRNLESHPRRHTVTTEAESSNVRGIAYRFETKRANSVVTAPVRTIDTFIVADSEASVRVLAEKAKYENQVKTSAPTKRTIDTFIVPKSEASVCVSAETAKFETPEKQVRTTKRTIDTFIVPESKASVRVSAEKAKFETPEKLVKATVRAIDTFIVPQSEASVCVSAEKAKFESPEQQTQLTGPVVRTIDTFIVPESEVSVRVAAERAKLEALEKQKQSELEAQAAMAKQKLERTMSLGKAKLEEASQSTEEVKTVEDVTMAHEAKKVEVVEETNVAQRTDATMKVEGVREIEATKEIEETKVASETEVASETRLVLETKAVTAVNAEETRKSDIDADTVMTEEARMRSEIGAGKDEETDVVKATEVAKPTEVAAETKIAKETEEIGESEIATKRTDEVEETTDKEAEEVKKTETEVAKVSGVVETATTAEVTKKMASDFEQANVMEVAKKTELAAEIEVASEPKLKQATVKEVDVAKLTKESKKIEAIEIVEAEEIEGASKTEVTETEGENETKVAAVVEESLQTVDVTMVPKENEMVEVVEDIEKVKESEMITSIKEAKATEEVDDVVQESKKAEVIEIVKEIQEVTKTEEVTECEVVKTVEKVKVVNDTASEEEQTVQNLPNATVPVVEVTVERQTFGDMVSTAQHVHWLSLPVSVNPALARLHTVLSDHDPLTAYALYPSPPSPSSRSR